MRDLASGKEISEFDNILYICIYICLSVFSGGGFNKMLHKGQEIYMQFLY